MKKKITNPSEKNKKLPDWILKSDLKPSSFRSKDRLAYDLEKNMYQFQQWNRRQWVDIGEPFPNLGDGYALMLEQSIKGVAPGESRDLRIIIVGSDVGVLRLSIRRQPEESDQTTEKKEEGK